MVSAISSTTHTHHVTQTAPAKPKPNPPKPQETTTVTDTVSLSNAAKAALKEAIETRGQTVKEAAEGDLQAQRLLAKENVAAKPAKR